MFCHIQNTRLITRKSFRRDIFEAWDFECAYCGEKATTLDHVIARSRGGLTVAENLAPACHRCNGAKSNLDWLDWFRQQAWHTIERELALLDWISLRRETRDLPPRRFRGQPGPAECS